MARQSKTNFLPQSPSHTAWGDKEKFLKEQVADSWTSGLQAKREHDILAKVRANGRFWYSYDQKNPGIWWNIAIVWRRGHTAEKSITVATTAGDSVPGGGCWSESRGGPMMNENWCKALSHCAEGMYILEEKSRRVVWTNDYMTKFHGGDCVGSFCWEVFLGKTEPCPFCPTLTEDDPVYSWDFFEPKYKCWMKVKHLVFRDGDMLYRAGNVNLLDDVMQLNLDTVQEISQLQGLLVEKRGEMVSLSHEANVDSLTGLWNRNRFQQDLERECVGTPGVGVLFLDLNNLKEINDRFRHATGDAMLCRVAQTLNRVREKVPQARCYRIGGDEYVLLLTKSSIDELEHCRELFDLALKEENEGQEHPCSVAVGQAFSDLPCDPEVLVSQADNEMYRCKQRMKGI